MKLTTELADIIRKKFIEKVILTQDEALKWNAYWTSTNRAIKRQAYKDATPEQRIALRQQTNELFDVACQNAIKAAIADRAFLEGVFRLLIQAGASALIAQAGKI